jgi:hypothetical protein
MRRRALCAIVMAAALAGPAACGGGEDGPKSESDRVKDVTERFNEAISGGDYGEACDLLVTSRREQLEFERDMSCEDIFGEAAESDPTIEQLGSARVTNVSVTGSLGLAEVEGGNLGPGHQAILEKADGEWRVSEPAAYRP